MTTNDLNPFLPAPLSAELPLPGRDEILDWVLKGIQQGARLLIAGATGIGKSSVLDKVGQQLQQQNLGLMLRVDVRAHLSIGSVAAEVQQFTDRLVSGSAVTDASKTARAPSQSMPTSAGITPSGSADLFAALDQLGHVASSQNLRVVIAIDDFPQLRRLGGALVDQGLRDSMQANSRIGFILTGTERELAGIQNDPTSPLHGQLESKTLGAADPKLLAEWIDQRFSTAKIVSSGAGAACVDIGGPRTADVIELARRTFDLAKFDRYANRATVSSALAQTIDEKKGQYAAMWDQLSGDERSALKSIARGRTAPPAGTGEKASPAIPPQAKAVNSLIEKGLVEPIGSAGLRLESPALRGWALEAQVNVTRQATSPSQASSLRFAFDLRATRAAVPAAKSISP